MNITKKVAITGAIASLLLLTSVSAFADTTTQNTTQPTAVQTMRACIKAANMAYRTAIKAANDAYKTAVMTARTTRKTSLDAARKLTDKTARKAAVQAANDAYKTAVTTARTTRDTAKDAANTQHKTALDACPKA